MLMSQDFEATAADIYLKYRFDATSVVGRNQIENSGAIDLTVAGTKRALHSSFLGWPHGAIKNGADSLCATRPEGAIWFFATLFRSFFPFSRVALDN